jgi:hypothetical protein
MHGLLLQHAFAFYVGVLGLSNDHDRLTASTDWARLRKSRSIVTASIRSEASHTRTNAFTHRIIVNTAFSARPRSPAWLPSPQKTLRMLAVHLRDRNELVEDQTLFPLDA